MKSLLMVMLISIAAIAHAETKPAAATAPTTEQRQEMAKAHEKMAACLRSTQPIDTCHEEMMGSCQSHTDGKGCMMMNHGHGGSKGQGKPGRK